MPGPGAAPDVAATSLTVNRVVESCRSLPTPKRVRFGYNHPAPRPAATLLPIVPLDGSAGIVVTKRTEALEHGGDWVFPGGNLADHDVTHQDAARREASEELGIGMEAIEVIGQLSIYGPIVTGHVIESYVGVIRDSGFFSPDSVEVSQLLTIPLADLTCPTRSHVGPIPDQRRVIDRDATPGAAARMRFYEVAPGQYLWGLQADLLHELLRHVTGGAHHIAVD